MFHTALNQWSAVLLSVCMTGRSVAWQNHQSSLRKRNICHQFLFLTVITPPLYCRKQDNWYWLKLSWCDDCGISGWKSSEQQGIGADFRSDTTLRSHAAKSTLVKREDLFNRGWKNTREMRFLYIKGCTRIVYIYICKNKQNFLCLTALLQLLLYGSDQVQSKLLTLRLHGVSKSDFSVFFLKGKFIWAESAVFDGQWHCGNPDLNRWLSIR